MSTLNALEPSDQSQARRRLIIVDDEPVLLRLLMELFDSQLDVVGCGSVAEARVAMARGVDVLLTDKNLPDGSGLDLLAEARQHTSDAEVLLITGYASLDTALIAMQHRAYDYIVKPPRSIFDVRRRVEQALEHQQMARQNRQLLADLQQRNSELESALREVRLMQSELVQSEKLAGIGTLAAGVAHEIASPLFGVMGLAEAITEEESLADAQEYAREIVGYSRAIKAIVTQLTGYTRRAEADPSESADLSSALMDATRLVRRTMGLSDDDIAVDVQPGLRVLGSVGALQQVFVNLLKNAVEAVRESEGAVGPRVRLRAVLDPAQDGVVCEVEDEGPGVPESARHAIFDPFFTTKAPGKGTGLGLNIVYRIINQAGGHIVLDPEHHSGAKFVVRLPAAHVQAG